MKTTKIDWADSTWNPVTGCLNDCEYCYARRIAARFEMRTDIEPEDEGLTFPLDSPERFPVLDKPVLSSGWTADEVRKQPYPFGFSPTFHRYRLDEPQSWKNTRNIFVCSMADLFGDWVREEWIMEVMEATKKAPQHRYLFLTKNPKRYMELHAQNKLPRGDRYWYGTTITTPDEDYFFAGEGEDVRTFISIEPIRAQFGMTPIKRKYLPDWVIIGAETGNRRDKVIPERVWIWDIATQMGIQRVPVFMKESLGELMGEDFRQEFPEELEAKG